MTDSAGSLSKTLLPGARVGYLVARSPWIERAIALKQATTLAEHLARECLDSGLLDRHLRRLVPRLESNLRRMQDGVVRSFPAGTRVSRPRGGFLLWVELPAGGDGLALLYAFALIGSFWFCATPTRRRTPFQVSLTSRSERVDG